MVCLLQPRVLDEWHHMDHAHMNRHLPALAGRTIRLKLGEHKRQRSGVSTRGICRGSSEDHRARTRQQLVSETAKPQDGRSSNDPTSVLRSQRTATGIPPDLWSIDSTLSRSSPYSRSCIMGCLCPRPTHLTWPHYTSREEEHHEHGNGGNPDSPKGYNLS